VIFKTGGRQVFLSPVGSTPTRFRQNKGLRRIVIRLQSTPWNYRATLAQLDTAA
jgi:hypothetical protein